MNKHNRKTITVICDSCKKEYEKPISEYNRNKKLNRHSFCSRSCAGTFSNKNHNRSNIKFDHLLEYNNNKKANPFLYYIKIIKGRTYQINDITIEDLKTK